MAEETGEANIKITIRQSSGQQYEVQVKADCTVTELKKACEEGCGLPAESQRLIFKGKNNEID